MSCIFAHSLRSVNASLPLERIYQRRLALPKRKRSPSVWWSVDGGTEFNEDEIIMIGCAVRCTCLWLIQYFQYSYQNRTHVPSSVHTDYLTIRPNRIMKKTECVYISSDRNADYKRNNRRHEAVIFTLMTAKVDTLPRFSAKAHLHRIRVAVSKHQLMKAYIKKKLAASRFCEEKKYYSY